MADTLAKCEGGAGVVGMSAAFFLAGHRPDECRKLACFHRAWARFDPVDIEATVVVIFLLYCRGIFSR